MTITPGDEMSAFLEMVSRARQSLAAHLGSSESLSFVDAELVIVGSRGMGRVSGLLRGSVSSHVAAHAPHSFMVIHEDDDSGA